MKGFSELMANPWWQLGTSILAHDGDIGRGLQGGMANLQGMQQQKLLMEMQQLRLKELQAAAAQRAQRQAAMSTLAGAMAPQRREELEGPPMPGEDMHRMVPDPVKQQQMEALFTAFPNVGGQLLANKLLPQKAGPVGFRDFQNMTPQEQAAFRRYKQLGIAPPSVPANIQEHRFFMNLSPEERQMYLARQRGSQFQNLGGGVAQMDPITGVPRALTPKTLPPEKETGYLAAAEEAKLQGKGGISPIDKKQNAKGRVSGNLNTLAGLYAELDKMGAAVSTERSSYKNIANYLAASDVGQQLGTAIGTEEQSIRNKINQLRPLLMNDIRQASEMGARGLDSEKELEFYLQAATDPSRDVQSNMAAIKVLNDAYGLGGNTRASAGEIARLKREFKESAKRQPPRPGEERGGYRYLGGDPADQNSWEQIR